MKRLIFTFLLLLVTVVTFAVDNLFQAGGVDNNWSTVGNWSQGTVPTSTDGYVTRFDATSPNCTVNAMNRTVNALDFTGYTNTITMSYQIGVYGNVTLSSTMTIFGTGYLKCEVGLDITSNTKIIPYFNLGSNTKTINLIDNLTIGVALFQYSSAIITLNSNTMYISGDFNSGITTGVLTGTNS